MTVTADLDISSLWSWTLPLWILFLVVLFVGGVMIQKPVVQAVAVGQAMTGGALAVKGLKKSVRWAAGV